ncbi:MAG TPA: S1C family serine protease [Candidatus Acidoferrum sp.]|nr:S1C family serine protease [Candidatus Acidoferrum sp.]
MSGTLIDLSNALAQVTERVASTTVAVHAEARGSSTGVLWRPGVIVAAEHALRRDEEIQVTLPDGRVVPASLAGRDPSTDLAVLNCSEATASPVETTNATAVRPGAFALVVGRTRASGPVAAFGVVSLVASERKMWTGAALAPYIRLDLALQSTAAGGAAVDANGKVFGIATPRFARFGAIAVPTATVNRVVDVILEKGRIPRGYLGVGLQPVRLPEALRLSLQRAEKTAAIVLEVEPESPAHKAGMLIGDILISLEGKPVTHLDTVQSHLAGQDIGKTLSAKIVRGGKAQALNIVVSERERKGE